jgi:FtsP/CotA-like multicopper oxidase with cupredoxin domain
MSETASPSSASRRTFLRHGATAAVALPAVMSTLAACGETKATTAPPKDPKPAAPPPPSPRQKADEMDAMHEKGVKAFPAKTEGQGNQPMEPRMEGRVKVYDLTAEELQWEVEPGKKVKAWAYNRQVPGPQIRVREGDRVRVNLTNKLPESTAIHFHGLELPNDQDGVPFITQPPVKPGEKYTYEFTVPNAGSHMYHSHHNATDQVGRGLLGAFIVHPRAAADRVERKYGVSQDIVWISNDSLGGFTINGRGFPATSPIVATLGEKIVIRFMNEGVMMHPWHLHGMPMRVVARDGYPLGSAAFTCDTLGVNPGERWDVVIDCDAPGAWAFHCHILPHAEGADGMFGMVTALVVQEATATRTDEGGSPIAAAARAAGSTAFACSIPTIG